MNSRKWDAPRPRKLPRQSRAATTIETVLEAAVQLLIAEGPRGLTTTRVAKRSGFAVGTLYQYFANKDELIDMLLHRHLEHVASCIRLACANQREPHPGEMMRAVADAFTAANIERMRDVQAIHFVWMRVEHSDLFCAAFAQLHDAIVSMLAGVPQLKPLRIDTISYRLVSILIGTMRAMLEKGMDEALLENARDQIAMLSIETQSSSVDRFET
jgi:AcrR family transcriptional regulator